MATLQVTIVGLPAHTKAKVVVDQGGGPKRTVHKTTVLHLSPGAWTVTADPVHSGPDTYYPSVTTTTVNLSAGAAGAVTVDYASAISDTTRVASSGAIQSVTPPGPNGDQVVVVNDPQHTLAPGDTLVAGAAPTTPEGLLLDIRSVVRSGTFATVTGVAGSLTDIGPKGDIAASGSFSDPQEFDDPLTCSAAASASVTGSVDFSPTVELDLTWGGLLHPGMVTARARVTGTETASLAADINGSASCTFETDLLPSAVTLGVIGVLVGPVPIVLVPKLNFHLEADASLNGSLDASVTQSLAMTAGLNWDGSTLTPFSSITPSHSYQAPTENGSGSFHAQVGPVVTIDVEAIPGPFITTDAHADLTATLPTDLPAGSDNTPCWSLTAGLEAGGGLKLDVWGISFDKEDPAILSADWPVASDPCVTTGSLEGATDGTPYSDTLGAMGGVGEPYTWAITSGSLPDGLQLDPSTGEISGTPTSSGTFTFEIRVSDTNGGTGTASMELSVTGITQVDPTSGTTTSAGSTSFTDQLETTGQDGAVTFAITVSAPGIDVSPAGAISVTSQLSDGAYTVSGTDSDGAGDAGTWSYTLTVASASKAQVDCQGLGGAFAIGGDDVWTCSNWPYTDLTYLSTKSAILSDDCLGENEANGFFSRALTLATSYCLTPGTTQPQFDCETLNGTFVTGLDVWTCNWSGVSQSDFNSDYGIFLGDCNVDLGTLNGTFTPGTNLATVTCDG